MRCFLSLELVLRDLIIHIDKIGINILLPSFTQFGESFSYFRAVGHFCLKLIIHMNLQNVNKFNCKIFRQKSYKFNYILIASEIEISLEL